MNKPEASGPGIRNPVQCLLLALFSITLLVTSASAISSAPFDTNDTVHVNNTYTLVTDNTIPIDIWILAIAAGIMLILFSFFTFEHGEEAIISIMAWIPLGFALYYSFSVDLIGGAGVTSQSGTYVLISNHLIYQFSLPAAALFLMLMLAIGNTIRIVANLRDMKRNAELGEYGLIDNEKPDD